ncbi:hypothetical protein ABN028_11615 [Actinopolymorpha sp. B17G11]|uniref:hypothetical protein n=1 Tax=Actinopolymorpha sp. B17G11 TaxID=3160861 RepID=UPI0032E4B637
MKTHEDEANDLNEVRIEACIVNHNTSEFAELAVRTLAATHAAWASLPSNIGTGAQLRGLGSAGRRQDRRLSATARRASVSVTERLVAGPRHAQQANKRPETSVRQTDHSIGGTSARPSGMTALT